MKSELCRENYRQRALCGPWKTWSAWNGNRENDFTICRYCLSRHTHYDAIIYPLFVLVPFLSGENCFPQQRQTQINPRQINVTMARPIVLNPIQIEKWKMINLISIFIEPQNDSCHERCRPLKTYSFGIKRRTSSTNLSLRKFLMHTYNFHSILFLINIRCEFRLLDWWNFRRNHLPLICERFLISSSLSTSIYKLKSFVHLFGSASQTHRLVFCHHLSRNCCVEKSIWHF